MDPQHPGFLEPWTPSSGQRALVDDLALQYVARTPDFNRQFLDLSRDCYKDRSWPQIMLALLEAFDQHAVGSVGLELTIRRLAEDVRVARGDALEEMR